MVSTLYKKCIDSVENEWPLAYVDCDRNIFIDLKSHLVKTVLATSIFTDEIRDFSESIKWTMGGRIDVFKEMFGDQDLCEVFKDLFSCSALLHDLGKANRYYLEKFHRSPSPRLSFPLHEYVIAVLLVRIAMLKGGDVVGRDPISTKNALNTVANVIARHHTAMIDRDPVFVSKKMIYELYADLSCSRRDLLKILNDAISEVARNDAGRYLLGHLCRDILDMIKDYLQRGDSVKSIREELTVIESPRLISPKRDIDDIVDALSRKLIAFLAGRLIVLDNIVAGFMENRSSVDELTPHFVNTWRRELDYKIPKIPTQMRFLHTIRCP